MITAKITSDDGKKKVTFDAERWFGRAQDTEIIALSKSGWKNSPAADRVAIGSAQYYSEIAEVFAYLESARKKCHGFECEVNEKEAKEWIGKKRLRLATCISGIEISEEVIVCIGCQEAIEEDEQYSYESDGPYCCDCYNEKYSRCDHCENTYCGDDLTHIDDVDEYWCTNCVDEHASCCDNCGRWVTDYIHTADTDRTYCEPCASERRIRHCVDCDRSCEEGMTEDDNGGWVCSECLAERRASSPIITDTGNPHLAEHPMGWLSVSDASSDTDEDDEDD